MPSAFPNPWRWASDNKKPDPYDLLLLRLENEQVKSGWWTGQGWDGLKIRAQDAVIQWKRHYEEGI
jgi:hypothetical protein